MDHTQARPSLSVRRGAPLGRVPIRGDTDPTAVGEDDGARSPHYRHLAEWRGAEPRMFGAERVVLDDPSRLAPRLPGAQRLVHLEVGAVDGVPDGSKERDITLEGADRLRPGVAVRERQRYEVVVALFIGVLGQVALVDH